MGGRREAGTSVNRFDRFGFDKGELKARGFITEDDLMAIEIGVVQSVASRSGRTSGWGFTIKDSGRRPPAFMTLMYRTHEEASAAREQIAAATKNAMEAVIPR
jgi:hypothetical protein